LRDDSGAHPPDEGRGAWPGARGSTRLRPGCHCAEADAHRERDQRPAGCSRAEVAARPGAVREALRARGRVAAAPRVSVRRGG
jgi:hypothetical protein